ncbi:MAG: hypothetical protein LUG26_02685 [Ruminococcus sp.]|nr:hypothetical protein [Ruminococcus sp.]
MKSKEKKSERSHFICGIVTLLLAIFTAIASVVFIIFKCWSNKAYAEKWKDYDECGI